MKHFSDGATKVNISILHQDAELQIMSDHLDKQFTFAFDMFFIFLMKFQFNSMLTDRVYICIHLQFSLIFM